MLATLTLIGGAYALFLGTPKNITNNGIDPSLVGWWKLDGNANDSSGHGYNGTMTSGITTVTGHDGLSNSALYFDRSSSTRIGFPTGPWNTIGITSFTVSAWVKTVNTATNQASIMSLGGSGYGFRFGFGSDGCTYYLIGSDNSASDPTKYKEGHICKAGVTVNNGAWHLLTGVFAYSSVWTVTAYIDGASAGSVIAPSGAQSISSTSTTAYTAGGSYSGAYFTGAEDDLRFYSRALTPAEIQQLYSPPKVKLYSSSQGLVGWWKLNGNTLDTSPYHHNGIANNISYTTDRQNKANAAASFNGINSDIGPSGYANIGTNTPQTMSVWFKQTAQNTDQTLFATTSASCVGNKFGINSNNKLVVATKCSNDLTSSVYIVGNNVVSLNVWHLATFTYNSGICNLYLDGALSKSNACTLQSTGGSTSNIAMGFSNEGIGYRHAFVGAMSDARVYNRALSPTEISTQYKQYNPQIKISTPTTNINAGLVGYWPFNGSAIDMTPYHDNGTVTGATLTTNRNGRANSAYQFAGANDNEYIITSLTSSKFPDLTQTGFTMSIWYSRIGTAYNQWPFLMTLGSSHINYGIRSQGNYGSNIGFEWGISPYDGTNYTSTSSFVSVNNTWHLYTVTYNNNTVTYYVDGIQKTQLSAVLNPTHSTLGFGSSSATAGNAPYGSIDDARLYNRALSANEVKILYNTYN